MLMFLLPAMYLALAGGGGGRQLLPAPLWLLLLLRLLLHVPYSIHPLLL